MMVASREKINFLTITCNYVFSNIKRNNRYVFLSVVNSANKNRMDDIMALKNKHLKVTDVQMKEYLQRSEILMDDMRTKQDQLRNEDEIKIEELMSEISAMEKVLKSEKEVLEYKNQELTKHLDHIAGLEAEKNMLMEENHILELQRNKLKSLKRNIHDQELLDQGSKKYNLYKELTRIRWDYEDLKENIQGYVSNKVDYIHHFCYKSDDSNLTNLLWEEIGQSTVHTESKASNGI